MASVIHHVAIQIVLANTPLASADRPSGLKNANVKINKSGPKIRPIICAVL